MDKIIKFATLLVAVTLLAGCSISPIGLGTKKSKSNAGNTGSVWKSSDAGGSFQLKVNIEMPPEPVSMEDEKKKIVPPKQQIITSDILAISFHPENSSIIYAGTINNGIYKTENGGETWKHIDFPPKRIDSFTLDRKDPDRRMFASGVVNGIGKILRTEDGGRNWKEVYTEPGQKTLVTAMSQHEKNTDLIFAGTSDGTVIKSVDGGNTWKNIGQKINGKVTALPFDATLNNSVYALSFRKKLFYSSNSGETWIDWEEVKKQDIEKLKEKQKAYRKRGEKEKADQIKKQIEGLIERNRTEKMPTAIVSVRTSPYASGTIYAGTQKGELYRSVDWGKWWKKINIIESADEFPIRMIILGHFNKSEICFISGNAFYKSVNGGVTWSVTQLNADRPIAVITYDPKDNNIIYLGLSRDYDELKK